jgi:hypothetical protein
MNERRDHDRLPVHINARHILSEDRDCECEIVDLSLDGLRVRRVENDDWGQPRHVWLRFRLPGEGQDFQALGELRHDLKKEEVRGFRIKYMFPRARRRYEEFVRAGLQVA